MSLNLQTQEAEKRQGLGVCAVRPDWVHGNASAGEAAENLRAPYRSEQALWTSRTLDESVLDMQCLG